MNLDEMIKVGMADLKVGKSPDVLTTLGLGSCVGVAIYDPVTKISGLLHCMLPDSTQFRNNSNKAKYADSGIDELVAQMLKLGASKVRLVAKIAGGAQMFAMNTNNDTLRVGERNVAAVKMKLSELNIRLLSEDCGLNYGRTVELVSQERLYKLMKRFRNVSAIVTLLAGFITAVVMIINRYSLVSFLWILIGVMVCFYAVSRIICFIVDRKITKAEEQEEAERLEKEKERLEAEEKEATEGKNDESDAMNGNQRANR